MRFLRGPRISGVPTRISPAPRDFGAYAAGRDFGGSRIFPWGPTRFHCFFCSRISKSSHFLRGLHALGLTRFRLIEVRSLLWGSRFSRSSTRDFHSSRFRGLPVFSNYGFSGLTVFSPRHFPQIHRISAHDFPHAFHEGPRRARRGPSLVAAHDSRPRSRGHRYFTGAHADCHAFPVGSPAISLLHFPLGPYLGLHVFSWGPT